MNKIVLTIIATIAFIKMEALLPPFYQTSSEIKAIMADERLGKKLGSGDVIVKIEKNDHGYLITTNKHQLQVDLVYEKAERPGPSHYKLLFNDPSSL